MNLENKIPKKPLPWCPSKSEVYRIYVKVNQLSIRDEIVSIMQSHRNKQESEVKNIRNLLHPEFVKLVKFLGIPQGYYAPEGFFDEP